jgi:ribonuclease HII
MSNLRKKKLRDLSAIRDASETCDQSVHIRSLRGANERSNKELRQRPRFLVGVDEAGRGPLAGPVAIGVAVVPYGFDWKTIPGVGDSKKVSPKNREAIFRLAKSLKKTGVIDWSVILISAKIIDTIGITRAVAKGIERGMGRLGLNPNSVKVRLDGLLKAGAEYRKQKTIIKGDAKEKVIGLASILAKVTRDTYMVRLGKKYPEYGFEVHKGYGTLVHRKAIKKFGRSPVHRESFCRNILDSRQAKESG